MTVERIATYRLQFRNGMTFARAIEIIPYLRRLGISHIHASPVFSATSGSTHGYDIIDYNAFDPALGGEAGFDRLAAAIRNAGMGLILDIVPNHMAASLENRWWRSIIKVGRDSPFAHFFDIDWSRRLTLPVLGRPFRDALRAGEFCLAVDPQYGDLTLRHFDQLLPIQPASYARIAERLGVNAAKLDHPQAESLDPVLAEISRDLDFLERLHAAQGWELHWWKNARRELSYRRFFEVTGLVGMRVEDDAVFDQMHRLVLSAIRSGAVDGVRVDHVDGLSRPTSYLQRLRRAVGPGFWILVEKILAQGERLPESWHAVGTTGYEFIASANALLSEREGVERMRRLHAEFTGKESPDAHALREARNLVLTRNFEGELSRLVDTAAGISLRVDGPGEDSLRAAITEIALGFDIYRTYGETGELSVQDRAALARATAAARRQLPQDAGAIDFVAQLLNGSDLHPAILPDAEDFRCRFQQLTGPVMAKSLEDTHFYRSNALLAWNEVGCPPDPAQEGVQGFHATMGRDGFSPDGLLATATHDTKRGEDARARLLALAELPDHWVEAARRWHQKHAGLKPCHKGEPQPDPAVEWLIYQAIAGAIPHPKMLKSAEGRKALADRFLPYLEKALREAKLQTDWLEIDEEYEQAVLEFVSALLDPARSDFPESLAEILRPYLRAGAVNSLTQCLAKLTVPGVPDIYQGSEQLDVSLVDPDNRRPVDYERLRLQLGRGRPVDVDAALLDGRFKHWMIATTLSCRREDPALFLKGGYIPVQLAGPGAVHFPSYLRECNGKLALVVLHRLSLRQPADAVGETRILLPETVHGRRFRNVLSDGDFIAGGEIGLETLLPDAPVGLAVTTDH